MTWDDYRKALWALVLWREARGEGPEGMRAVAHVIDNRKKAGGFGFSLIEVITGRNQFSSMSTPGDSQLVSYPHIGDTAFEAAMGIVERIFSGQDEDITHGALYYANLDTATSSWFFEHIVNDKVKHPLTVKVGRHSFFK